MAKELVEIAGRKYRLCEDAHLAISEKKSLVWINNGKVFPLRVGSTNYGPRKGVVFFHGDGDMGETLFVWYPNFEQNMLVYIDVTPEKRYAVWNKKYQRFTLPPRDYGSTEVFKSRSEAEAWIQKRPTATSAYSVVEFDNPDSE